MRRAGSRRRTGIGMTVPVPEVAVDEAAQATKIRTLDEQTAKARQRLNDAEVQPPRPPPHRSRLSMHNKVLASHSHLEHRQGVGPDLDDLRPLQRRTGDRAPSKSGR